MRCGAVQCGAIRFDRRHPCRRRRRSTTDARPSRCRRSRPRDQRFGIELQEQSTYRVRAARMAGNGVPVLLITANVGSIFEEVCYVRKCVRARRAPSLPSRDNRDRRGAAGREPADRSIAHVDSVRLFIHATHDLLAAASPSPSPPSPSLRSFLLSPYLFGCRWLARIFRTFVHTRTDSRSHACRAIGSFLVVRPVKIARKSLRDEILKARPRPVRSSCALRPLQNSRSPSSSSSSACFNYARILFHVEPRFVSPRCVCNVYVRSLELVESFACNPRIAT